MITETKNLRGFYITFLGATNTRGARVKIKDLRFNKSLIISYDYSYNSIKEIAFNYLKAKGISCLYEIETEKGFILATKNFNEIKNEWKNQNKEVLK